MGGLGPLFLQRFFLPPHPTPVVGLPLCVCQVVGGVSVVPEAVFIFLHSFFCSLGLDLLIYLQGRRSFLLPTKI